MKKGVKIAIGAAVVVVAAAGIFSILGRKPEVVDDDVRPAVVAEKPQTGTISLYTDVIGTIEPSETVSVTPKIDGEILEVMFEAGQYVEAGQPLCRIDSDALTALRISMESAQVAMNDADSTLQRTQALFAGGTVSQQAFEQAQNAATSARLQYEAAKNQYDLQVEYTTVTAPISGIAESRNVDPHDNISTSDVIAVISAKDQIMVKFSVPERVMKNLQTGMAVTVDKYGTEYQGNITEVASVADTSNGLYDIKAAIQNGEALTTGSKAKVSVLKDIAENVMTIPVDSVSYDDGNPFIYIYDNGVAKRVGIESGIYDMERMEVEGGLNADDLVITSWSNELSDGVEVVLADEETESQVDESSAEGGEGAAESAEAEE
ncbi:MAG TPA: efflux RND transporter periplasmic adaptor subunit [Candidatus Lachnoclostridium stercoravium]|uniref:Efflux RND transporter periplasmic adaptor subunit n=1 Tax=Candidatus Lachnoclostridium stercoravium TaxID=2838633 RepID=A0A9D2KNH3_9FIRM|nr:efflux RND transporter periplasmic adaptor subunit [Candidatus Lachnoclostridium stercoravium]